MLNIFLHIGNNASVKISDIVGIFDCDNSTLSQTTVKFLSLKEKAGLLSTETDDVPRSYVLLRDGRVIMSLLSSQTLWGRMYE